MVTHRWVALVIGLVLLVVAASGAALVFEGAIDRGLNPSLWHVTATGPALPLDTLVARVEAKYGSSAVGSVVLSTSPDRAWVFSAGSLSVFVNPYTGAITGTRTPAESQTTFARRLHVLHVQLFAGRAGSAVVGATCVVAMFLVLTGIILWWPDKLIRIHTGASWKRINFDLHHAVGITAAAILLVITASGIVVHYGGVASRIRALDATPTPPPPDQPKGSGSALASRLSFDAIRDSALRRFNGASVMFISLGGPDNPVVVAMRYPEDRTPAGRSRVFIDRYSGAILGAVSTRDAQIGTRLSNINRSLHTGDVLGKWTEALWFLATLAMVEQIVSGVVMWWNARRGRTLKGSSVV